MPHNPPHPGLGREKSVPLMKQSRVQADVNTRFQHCGCAKAKAELCAGERSNSRIRLLTRAAGCWALSRGDTPAADTPAAVGELTLRLRLTTLEAETRSGRGVPNRLLTRRRQRHVAWICSGPQFVRGVSASFGAD